ncbi:MAG: DNA-processing protein DprA [Deltaproteobacteria bacterium]|nr:DNA-processing protein DprA [Deltaproteobacteria bacterium]MBW2026573.1 DNA-processing protein DprA [Deltaproteobacteria bacterium]
MSYVAVVGSRSLPLSWRSRVSAVVSSLLARGLSVGSGGALGADLFALRAVVLSGASACSGSVVFLPGPVESSPRSCRSWLASFRRLGGRVVPGPACPGARRREFVSALFARSRRLVRGSRGVVAFVSGRSAGSWFTCQFAASLGLPVVVFPVEGPGALRSLGSGGWVRLRCWSGAFRWVPEKKGGLS